jgi:hypothetical protein
MLTEPPPQTGGTASLSIFLFAYSEEIGFKARFLGILRDFRGRKPAKFSEKKRNPKRRTASSFGLSVQMNPDHKTDGLPAGF